jgi:hypothetical protein
MPKRAISDPSGNGGSSGAPFTKWAFGTAIFSERPAGDCSRGDLSADENMEGNLQKQHGTKRKGAIDAGESGPPVSGVAHRLVPPNRAAQGGCI